MGPTWPFFLMYGSHGMRHTGFLQVDDGQPDTPILRRHNVSSHGPSIMCNVVCIKSRVYSWATSFFEVTL